MNKNWVDSIKNPKDPEASYKDFHIYYSPALDNRALQTDLSISEYAEWVVSYTGEGYSPDFISPFSSNHSTLQHQTIDDTSLMSDTETMWELDMLVTLKE